MGDQLAIKVKRVSKPGFTKQATWRGDTQKDLDRTLKINHEQS